MSLTQAFRKTFKVALNRHQMSAGANTVVNAKPRHEGGLPKMRNRLLLAILAIGATCSCGPVLRPYDEHTNMQADFAPLVVVGLAEHDERIGQPILSRQDPRHPMQLHRITVHIENVLKGTVPQRTIPVYYFAHTGAFDVQHPLIFRREPSRRMLCLRKDQGQYRIACDGSDCTMRIMSGAHPGFRMNPGEPIERAMTELRLTRGEGPIDDHQFALDINRGAPERDLGYVIEKLRHLAVTESSEVKYAACRFLWVFTRGTEDHVRRRAEDSLHAAGCTCGIENVTEIVCR